MATQVASQAAARVERVAVSGGVPLLASKMTAPGVPDWALTRPRITRLIARGTRWCPLTVLTGPAGAGKTMALALWTAARPGTVAWVCLDEFDNRPEVFWSYVVAALRRSGVAVPAVLPAARGRAGDHRFLLGLAGALAAHDPPVTLVLDDLQLLTDPRVLDGLDYVLRTVGAGLRLAVSARMDPLLVHRYRLAGELTEIRAGDLAFTVPEAGELMARHGITLTAGSLEARANAFVQPAGSGCYRYHRLFAEVLRLTLDREHPDRAAALHRRAARWYERNGQLTDAVRHAAQAGDWPLAASIVIDGLVISQIIEPRGSPFLGEEFKVMPHGRAWTEPAPHLVSAAVALSAGRPEFCIAALDAADGILERLPADQEAPGRLAATLIRLAAARRTGDLTAAAAAAARAEVLASRIPDAKLARRPDMKARLLSGRGAVELWSGQLDQAARTLESGVAAATAPGGEGEPGDCLGHLALVEALRGRLGGAATWAAQATSALADGEPRPPVPHPSFAALVALAWVHLEHNELREARRRLKQRTPPSP